MKVFTFKVFQFMKDKLCPAGRSSLGRVKEYIEKKMGSGLQDMDRDIMERLIREEEIEE